MPRIQPIDPAEADDKAQALLGGVHKALGMTPNLMRTLAHSSAALEAYLGFGKALGTGRLDAKLREAIALVVSGEAGCEYCASAHTALGKMLGADEAELTANLEGRSGDAKVEAALTFAHILVTKRGWADDDDLARVREAGYDEGEIIEIIATVALTTFTNYFNHVAGTEVDFPLVTVDERVAA